MALCTLVAVFVGSVAAKLAALKVMPVAAAGGLLAAFLAAAEVVLLILIVHPATRRRGLLAARVFFGAAALYVLLTAGFSLPGCGCFGRWVALAPEIQMIVIVFCLGLVGLAERGRQSPKGKGG